MTKQHSDADPVDALAKGILSQEDTSDSKLWTFQEEEEEEEEEEEAEAEEEEEQQEEEKEAGSEEDEKNMR